MAQPRAYTRQANFTDHTTEQPSDPQVGSKLDSEFDAINLTLNDIRTNLSLIQRDDTKVANLAIHAEALSTAVLALIKATSNGYGVKGAWAASTAYVIGDLVESSSATYLCFEAHTSGSTFSENSAKFILLANAAIQTTASAVDTLDGDGSATAFTLSANAPSGVTDVLVFVNGSLQTPTTHYTISGTTITFTTAPSSGTDNVIVWGTSTVVEAAKTAAQAARDTALAHRDDASEHKTTAERWAKLEDATVVDADTSVDSGEYSSKEYAVGDTVTTGSAKDWASKAYNSAVVTSPSNEYSAKHYATNIQEWATKDDGAVSGSDYSAKAHASVEGANAPPEGSSREWATEDTDVVVADSEYSAKHYAAKASADYASFTGVYKTGATDPYSSKDAGDLWYDTSGSVLKTWSGSAWQPIEGPPQDLDTTDTPTFATPTSSGHAAIKSYVDGLTGSNITALGTVTSGTLSTGAVIADPTMTQGSDATGDVYYRAADGKLTRLPTTASGQVLTSTGVGAVPNWAPAHVTDSNYYTYLANAELSSKGILKRVFFGGAYHYTTTTSPSTTVWTQLTGWTKMTTTGSTGATDADPFGRMSSGVWEPTIAGYYLCHLAIGTNQGSGAAMYMQIRRCADGSDPGANGAAGVVIGERHVGGSTYSNLSCTGLLPCGVDDTITFWMRIDGTSVSQYGISDAAKARSHMFVAYMGSSTI